MKIKEEYQKEIKMLIDENIKRPTSEIKGIIRIYNNEIVDKLSKSGKYKNNEIIDLIVNGANWKNEIIMQIGSIKNQLKQEYEERKAFERYMKKQQIEYQKEINKKYEEKKSKIIIMIIILYIISTIMILNYAIASIRG